VVVVLPSQEYQNYLDAPDDIKSVVLEDFKELSLRLAFTFGVAHKKTRNALITLVHSGIMYAAEDVPAHLHFLSGLPRFVSSLASQTTAKYMYAPSPPKQLWPIALLNRRVRVVCGVCVVCRAQLDDVP
jgi:hypothetical protein